MDVSRVMVANWIQFILAILGLPALMSVIPVAYMPYVAAIGGGLTAFLAWWNEHSTPLGVMGILTLIMGILAVPQLFAIVPVTVVPVLTLISSVLALVLRANENPSTTAVRALIFKPMAKAA